MRRILWVAVGVLMCGCGAQQPSVSATATHAVPKASPSPTVAIPPAPGLPPAITVLAVGASASTQGMLGVAVVKNPLLDRGAAQITVTFTASSGNGQAPVTAAATLAGLGAGESQAVTAQLLPPADDAIANVTAAASAAAAGAPGATALVTGVPQFHAGARSAATTVSVTNRGAAAATASVVVVCYDKANGIIGGGEGVSGTVAAGATATVDVAVAVPDTPARCQGFARPGG